MRKATHVRLVGRGQAVRDGPQAPGSSQDSTGRPVQDPFFAGVRSAYSIRSSATAGGASKLMMRVTIGSGTAAVSVRCVV